VFRYWWPTDGRGPINNDTFGVVKGAKNPVLAHLFLNHLLDVETAYVNFVFNFYQQPLTQMTPASLVQRKLIAPNLQSTIIRAPQFQQGYVQGPLSQDGQVLWENAWAAVKSS
jgi:spermidine/putrescine transport system substrate-binding protein